MTEEQREIFNRSCDQAANGNPLAAEFIGRWLCYFRSIEKLAQMEQCEPEKFLNVLAETNLVYSCPYYTQNAAFLTTSVAQMLNDFGDCLAWRAAGEDWQKRMAETFYHAGETMVLQVAVLEGGFSLMRAISPRLREAVQQCHVDISASQS